MTAVGQMPLGNAQKYLEFAIPIPERGHSAAPQKFCCQSALMPASQIVFVHLANSATMTSSKNRAHFFMAGRSRKTSPAYCAIASPADLMTLDQSSDWARIYAVSPAGEVSCGSWP